MDQQTRPQVATPSAKPGRMCLPPRPTPYRALSSPPVHLSTPTTSAPSLAHHRKPGRYSSTAGNVDRYLAGQQARQQASRSTPRSGGWVDRPKRYRVRLGDSLSLWHGHASSTKNGGSAARIQVESARKVLNACESRSYRAYDEGRSSSAAGQRCQAQRRTGTPLPGRERCSIPSTSRPEGA